MADPSIVGHSDPWIGPLISAALNFLGAVALAGFGYVHHRLNKVEAEADVSSTSLRAAVSDAAKVVKTDIERQLAEVKATHEREERVLWEAFEAERQRSQQFRELVLRDMVTRSDLSAMRSDVKEHITHVVAGAVSGLRKGGA